MQLRQPSPDALVSFSDFLLERFGLVASMQVAVVASLGLHLLVIVGVGFRLPAVAEFDAPHNVMDVVLVNAGSSAERRSSRSRSTCRSWSMNMMPSRDRRGRFE